MSRRAGTGSRDGVGRASAPRPLSSVERPGLSRDPARQRGRVEWPSGPSDGLAIARDRHQREVDAVQVILQVEDPGEAGAGEAGLVPGAVGALRLEQVLDAAADGLARRRARRRSGRATAQAVCEAVGVAGARRAPGRRSCGRSRPSRRTAAGPTRARRPPGPAPGGPSGSRWPSGPAAPARCRRCS